MDSRAEKQVLYTGKIITLELHHFKGDDGRKRVHEVVTHPGAAVVLPVLPDGRVMLVRTYRDAVRQHLIELPAGKLEAGETPINCAGRELMEETGYVAGKLTRIGSFYSSPGVFTEKIHAFLATDLLQSAGETDPDEKLELMPTTLKDALSQVTSGEIIDAKTIVTLLLFEAKRKAGH